MYKFFLISIYLMVSIQPTRQESKLKGKFHSREVIIQEGEKLIKVNILTEEIDTDLSNEKEYFWFKNGMIKSNFGGNGGKLLHGTYIAFIDNNLKESGQFLRGLKSGLWKSWYSSGKLESICNWKEGAQEGTGIFFNPDGTIKQKIKFNNGEIKKILTVKSESFKDVGTESHKQSKIRIRKKQLSSNEINISSKSSPETKKRFKKKTSKNEI